VVTGSYAITWSIIYFSSRINSYFGIAVSLVIAYFTISVKSLGSEASRIQKLLLKGEVERTRVHLSGIVGRDTDALSESEIVRATVETVAENTSDAVIAPLFYMLVGGPSLAMAYKAINTLDSMLGYKNERYLMLGWASARCDDAANFIPARITGFLFIVSALFLGKDWMSSYRVMMRDAGKHASPNSGYPESAVAGALNVKLGGTNYYGGIARTTGIIGNGVSKLTGKTITNVVRMMYLNSALMVGLGVVILEVVG
jgi:adenosylcobinamide-phosphate synthase